MEVLTLVSWRHKISSKIILRPLKKYYYNGGINVIIINNNYTLAWKIPWTEEPGGLQSMGLLGVWHDWATSLSFFTFMHWRGKWQPTPVFLPGGTAILQPGGLPSMGSHRVGHDWSDLAYYSSYYLIHVLAYPEEHGKIFLRQYKSAYIARKMHLF